MQNCDASWLKGLICLVFQGCNHAKLNIVQISPAPNLSAGLTSECCVEDQESLSALAATLDA